MGRRLEVCVCVFWNGTANSLKIAILDFRRTPVYQFSNHNVSWAMLVVF